MSNSEIVSFSASTCDCCRRSPSQRAMDDRAAKFVEKSVRCPLCNRACPDPSAAQLTAFDRQNTMDQRSEQSFRPGNAAGKKRQLRPLHRLTYAGSGSTFYKNRSQAVVRVA